MSTAPPKIIAILLAGGQGQRLYPLTRDRAKPAVPFGGTYRIIDFTLSNCINSGIRRIFVLTQYKSSSLDYHMHFGWNILSPALGEFIHTIPPQQRVNNNWYLGTADAIYQNIYTLERERPDHVLILSGDHIYKMNYGAMVAQHLDTQADLTIACIPVPKSDASRFGVAAVEGQGRIVEFQEKHPDPTPMPSQPDTCLASMGVYLFRTETLVREVMADAKSDTKHDFGGNIIPSMVKTHRVFAHDFQDENGKPEKYWRDIGTRDAYWEANMDLVAIDPLFNLYDPAWPIRNAPQPFPPAKTISVEGDGVAINSLLSNGCIVSGAHVEKSILSPNVRVEPGARVTESVIMDDCTIGRGTVIHRCIIDKRVRIPSGVIIGMDPQSDAERFMTTTRGVVMVPSNTHFT